MRILIYAFEPFNGNKVNVSKTVLNRLATNDKVSKVVLPVKFEREIFEKTVKETKPDFILGLGQYPRGNKIRIEQRAVNLENQRPIVKNGEKFLYTNLKITPDKVSELTNDAGQFVCNFSMYVILSSINKNKIKFGFLHIPKQFDTTKAASFIQHVVDSAS